jgi:hypothetical protein
VLKPKGLEELLVSPELAGFEQALEIFYAAVEDVIRERFTPQGAMTEAQRQVEDSGP